MIPWYKMPAKSSRDLIMLIIISQLPVRITAGKLVDLTLVTFAYVSTPEMYLLYFFIRQFKEFVFIGQVMKTAFAYLNLLRKFI